MYSHTMQQKAVKLRSSRPLLSTLWPPDLESHISRFKRNLSLSVDNHPTDQTSELKPDGAGRSLHLKATPNRGKAFKPFYFSSLPSPWRYVYL